MTTKNLKTLPLIALVLLMLPSCVVSTYMVTDNPVGKKTGTAKSKLFGNTDLSLEAAAKNGKITQIGTVQVKTTYYLIFPVTKTIVTGE